MNEANTKVLPDVEYSKAVPAYGDKIVFESLSPTDTWEQHHLEPAPPGYNFARMKERDLAIANFSHPISKLNDELIRGHTIIHDTPENAHEILERWRLRFAVKPSDDIPDSIWNGEADIGQKISFQRRYPTFFYAGSQTPPKIKLPAEWKLICKAVVKRIVELGIQKLGTTDRMTLMKSVINPLDTNSGDMLFSNLPEDRLLTANALGYSFNDGVKDLVSKSLGLRTSLGLNPEVLFPIALAKRLSPMRKPTPFYVPTGSGLMAKTQVTGLFCRARQVYMVSAIVNALISGVEAILKAGRSQISGLWHDKGSQDAYLKDFASSETFESDISGYDRSFSLAHRTEIYTALVECGVDPIALGFILEWERSTGIMTPSIRNPGYINLYMAILGMGLPSGYQITTSMGTIGSLVTVLYSYLRMNIISMARILAYDWPIVLILGDDILNKVVSGFNEDKYIETFALCGFEIKTLNSCRFLMKHHYKGERFTVLARTIQQTLSNEDDYNEVGHLFIGLASRLSLPVYPALKSMLDEFIIDLLTNTKWRDFNFSYDGDPTKFANSLLSDPRTDAFLKSAAGMSWGARLQAEANYKQSAADTLDLLRNIGYEPPQTAVDFRNQFIDALLLPKSPDLIRQSTELMRKRIQKVPDVRGI